MIREDIYKLVDRVEYFFKMCFIVFTALLLKTCITMNNKYLFVLTAYCSFAVVFVVLDWCKNE
jgi:hypothetical protein